MRRLAILAAFGVALTLGDGLSGASAASADSAPSIPTSAAQFYVSGAGYGHGVGMSQYGAAGMALHGADYRQILSHYYTGTTVGRLDDDPVVTVLLHQGGATFSGARTLEGPFKASPLQLLPNVSYRAIVAGSKLRVVRAGHTVGTFTPPLTVTGTAVPGAHPDCVAEPVPVRVRHVVRRVVRRHGHRHVQVKVTFKTVQRFCSLTGATTGSGSAAATGSSSGAATGDHAATSIYTGPPLTLAGVGSYDGTFVLRPRANGGVLTVNALPLDDYLRGVVAAEMPSRWPPQALEAQAVAARTYALTENVRPAEFDLYADTRSQMYQGIRAQTPASDAAVAATQGQVVEYDGHPVLTYYFASSGGHTESVQNVYYGATPEPWLVGVPDPYDDSFGNPYYRWRYTYSLTAAAQKLSSYFQGSFEGIDVTRTGASPRVVQARVVGTKGSDTVTGYQLERAFGGRSTYLSFATLEENGERTLLPPPAAPASTRRGHVRAHPDRVDPGRAGAGRSGAGRSGAGRAHPERARPVTRLTLRGSVFPAQRGATVVAQQYQHRGWANVGRAQLDAGGAYAIPVAQAGVYRILFNGLDGPNVRVP